MQIPRFRCKMTLHLIPEPEEKGSELLRDLTANDKPDVNFYYFYCLDEDFGPFFIKFCSYFPYTAKLCINGHEYLKCQLERRGIDYEALDNGISWCEDVPAAQRICDRFDEQKIEAFFRKWLRRLPHPFSAQDRRAGWPLEKT